MIIFKVITILILIIVFIFPAQGLAAIENLDEMFNRKARRSVNEFPYSQLENSANNYIWQPETLMYRDITTGKEVWKLTNTPNLTSYYHNDIGLPVWSADGKRTAFSSIGRITQAYSLTQQQEWQSKWMVLNTNGSFMRPVVEAARRIGGGYFEWSPQIPEVFYEIGDTHLGTGSQTNVLYKSTLNNSNVINRTSLITGISGIINKMLSSDGRKVIVENLSTYYPATVYPDSVAGLNDNSYSMDRNFGLYGNMSATAITNYHDQYIAGDGSWFYAMPSGSSVWWRMKTLGSAADGGPLYTGNNGSNNFGEVWPENHGSETTGNLTSPFVQVDPYISTKTCYWSHFTPDRWGKRALFSSTCDGLPNGYGPGTWDIQNHQWNVPSYGGSSQHHDWHGFTDYVVSSRGTGSDFNYLNDRIYIAKYNDPASQQTIAYTHTLYNSGGIYGGAGTQYASLTRPAQSPDGTKVAFHSTFLNASDYNPDIFWAVAYYPYSPTNLSATYQGGINLQWLPPKYTDRNWPYASPNPQKDSLGWPLLDANGNEIGEPLYAREIKKYHIWRSSSQTGPWQEVGSTNADYSPTYAEDSNMFMLHPIAGGLKVSPTNKISFTDNPSDGVFYYAITSEEHSGLESDKLSEIIRITKSGLSVSSQIVVSQGQNNFWKELPQAPTAFSYTAQTTAGQYRLNWTEPNDSKIRYYNIYYNNVGAPQIDQKFRIASVSVGVSTYIDWLADISVPGYYLITSVDRYGNESSSDTIPPSSPAGLVVQ